MNILVLILILTSISALLVITMFVIQLLNFKETTKERKENDRLLNLTFQEMEQKNVKRKQK